MDKIQHKKDSIEKRLGLIEEPDFNDRASKSYPLRLACWALTWKRYALKNLHPELYEEYLKSKAE